MGLGAALAPLLRALVLVADQRHHSTVLAVLAALDNAALAELTLGRSQVGAMRLAVKTQVLSESFKQNTNQRISKTSPNESENGTGMKKKKNRMNTMESYIRRGAAEAAEINAAGRANALGALVQVVQLGRVAQRLLVQALHVHQRSQLWRISGGQL